MSLAKVKCRRKVCLGCSCLPPCCHYSIWELDHGQHTLQAMSIFAPPVNPSLSFWCSVLVSKTGDAWWGSLVQRLLHSAVEDNSLLLGTLPPSITADMQEGVGYASAHLRIKLWRRMQVVHMVWDGCQGAGPSLTDGS